MDEKRLTIQNQYMFGRVMCDERVCKAFLERVLKLRIESIEYKNAEQVMEPRLDSKGVRLDVFAAGPDGVYDIEMQAQRRSALGRRFRYYQAAIDTASISKGDDYDILPESYIIFVCGFDPFGSGEPVYTMEVACRENDGVDVGSGMHWVALNSPAYVRESDRGIRSLLNYVQTGYVDEGDPLVVDMDAIVADANADRKWVRNVWSVSTIEEDIRREARISSRIRAREAEAKGLAKGEAKGRTEAEIRYGKLIDILLDADRADDLRRSANDAGYREALFKEFDI